MLIGALIVNKENFWNLGGQQASEVNRLIISLVFMIGGPVLRQVLNNWCQWWMSPN